MWKKKNQGQSLEEPLKAGQRARGPQKKVVKDSLTAKRTKVSRKEEWSTMSHAAEVI